MTVPGIVTNITNFGAFVDIGVKQDGLVHISQLSDSFVSDPNTVVKLQQKVMVTVTEVDVARKRIALTMKTENATGNNKAAGKPQSSNANSPTIKTASAKVKKEAPVNDFQTKLMELKKKFK
jgi:uncharacterized protein